MRPDPSNQANNEVEFARPESIQQLRSAHRRLLRPDGALPALAAVLCAVLFAPPPAACDVDSPQPFVADDQTIFLLHFDQSDRINSLRPGLRILGTALPGAEGRFGRAVRLPPGTELDIDLLASSFSPIAGTLEFWIRPRWTDPRPSKRSVLSAFLPQDGPPNGYLAVNRQQSRFGVAVLTKREGTKQYGRADTSVAEWSSNTWHHVAATWNRGELTLWLDGVRTARVHGTRLPNPPPNHLLFTGSDYDLDELRLSRGVRYPPAAEHQLLKKPEAPVLPKGNPAAHGKTLPPRAFAEPADAYRLRTPLPPSAGDLGIFIKPGLNDFNPSADLPEPGGRIELAGAPGEVLAGSGVVAAASGEHIVYIASPTLAGATGTHIAKESIDFWQVIRTPRRVHTILHPDRRQIVGAFLAPWQRLDLESAHFREFWVTIRLPESTDPGTYSGTLTFRSSDATASVPINVEVWPARLKQATEKRLGVYYLMESKLIDPVRIKREVHDLIDHGVGNIVTNLAVQYNNGNGNGYVADVDVVERGLELLTHSGFQGVVVCKSGFDRLARRLGVMSKSGLFLREPGQDFDHTAALALRDLERLDRRFANIRLFVSHMDEIFVEPQRLAAYTQFSQLTRKRSELPLYVTLSMWNRGRGAWPPGLLPLVDVLSIKGSTFDTWLDREHRMEDLDQVLKTEGVSAWSYFNKRTLDYTPEWARIINGIYLWASPFQTHAPWAYQQIHGSAYSDGDGVGTDFVMTVPDPDNLERLSPSRYWEGVRQGWYDLRYLESLQSILEENPAAATKAVKQARQTLEWVRAFVAGPRGPRSVGPPPWKNMTEQWKSYEVVGSELPRVSAIAKTLTEQDWRRFRRHMAKLISELQQDPVD